MRFLILTLFLISACGKDVKFTNQLEESSAVRSAQPVAVTQTASLVRSTTNPPGSLQMNGQTFRISPFSSYIAMNFINQQPVGVQVPVKIRGEVKGNEIYIKLIEQ